MKRLAPLILLADLLLFPFAFLSAWFLGLIRRAGVQRMPRSRAALLKAGVFPIRRHYYEPQFDYTTSRQHFSDVRPLPGINWNVHEQLRFLSTFSHAQELHQIPKYDQGNGAFFLRNGNFESGDAEYWYQLIRTVKPRRIIEIGSGHSTRMAIQALTANCRENNKYTCEHICIEPFEMPWLEGTGVRVIREKVENVDPAFFRVLEENDILFIDSSHVIRPQGDVLFEYLELLPSLNKGVIVHVHDIFSPRNYPETWLRDEVKFWNEQYLLEAFLCHNDSWEIIGALNYLRHIHFEELQRVTPYLTQESEPGSIYLRKTR